MTMLAWMSQGAPDPRPVAAVRPGRGRRRGPGRPAGLATLPASGTDRTQLIQAQLGEALAIRLWPVRCDGEDEDPEIDGGHRQYAIPATK